MKSFKQYIQELDESSVMHYVKWGAIDPHGKVIEGDDEDPAIEAHGGSHQGLFGKLGLPGYTAAYKKGYIRFLLSKDYNSNHVGAALEYNDMVPEIALNSLNYIRDFLIGNKHEITGKVYIDSLTKTEILADNVNQAIREVNMAISKIESGQEAHP